MGFKNGEFSWHVWYRHPKTGVRKWCGQFLNERVALDWKKKQENPACYTINNVGPTAVFRASPEGQALKAQEDAERAARRKEQQERYERIKNGEIEKVTRPATATTMAKTRKVAAPVEAKAPVEVKAAPETKEQRRLKADAAKVLSQHKRDEAEDLKQGINR